MEPVQGGRRIGDMTREEILRQYNINEHGIIISPGKFEGEMIYMPHFYEAYLNGEANYLQDGGISIPIEKKEREEFPELGSKRRKVVAFDISDDGFIWERR